MSSISAGTTSTTTLVHSGDTTGSLVFKTNDTGSGGTTAVTIDTSQNVGIGTTSPATQLHLNSATPPNIRLQTDTTSSAMGVDFYYTSASGSKGGLIANFGAGEVRLSAGASGNSYFQSFYTNASERMRIDSSGNLLVGVTSQFGGAGANFVLSENSSQTNLSVMRTAQTSSKTMIFFLNGNGGVGSITTSGSSTAFNTSSDYRLKENIATMTGALTKVAQLKPVTYKWKADGSDGEGFIAHELAEVCPHAVSGEKDAVDAEGNPQYQGIDVSFLVATLTAAIQEQQALITAQAETINALTARVVALESK